MTAMTTLSTPASRTCPMWPATSRPRSPCTTSPAWPASCTLRTPTWRVTTRSSSSSVTPVLTTSATTTPTPPTASMTPLWAARSKAMQVKKNSDAFKLIDALGDKVGVYSGLTRNSDEFVTSLTEMDDTYSSTDYYYQVAVGTEAEDDETVGFGGKTYAYDEDVVVARYDGDDLSKSTIGRIRDDGNDEVYFVLDGRVLMGVLIVENEGTDAPDTVTVKVEDSQGGYTETVSAGKDVTLGYTAPEGYTITAATVNGTSVLKRWQDRADRRSVG